MPAYFVDTSALVKQYVDESGSDWVRRILRPIPENILYVAWTTGPEMISAVIRRRNRGELGADETDAVFHRFEREWQSSYRRIELPPSVLLQAMAFAKQYALRGYDAVQLAAAKVAQEIQVRLRLPSIVFVSSDTALKSAAHAEGFSIEDPNTYA